MGLIVETSEISQEDPNGEDFCGFDADSGVPPTGLICLGFIWRDGVRKPLSPIGGNNSYAAGVNNRGQAVGWAENSIQDPNYHPTRNRRTECPCLSSKPGRLSTRYGGEGGIRTPDTR